jgi:hypothetical protein
MIWIILAVSGVGALLWRSNQRETPSLGATLAAWAILAFAMICFNALFGSGLTSAADSCNYRC